MRVTPNMFGALFLILAAESFSTEPSPVAVGSDAPPYHSRLLDLLEYVGEPSVIRHRMIVINVPELIDVLGTANSSDTDVETPAVVFPLFDDVSFTVQFRHVGKSGTIWHADFVGTKTAENLKDAEPVWGNLTIRTQTNELMSLFRWKQRIFAIHFTGEWPHHLVVENDPKHMPAMD